MIIPIRCFTCGKVIGHMWQSWLQMINEDTPEGWAQREKENDKQILGGYESSCKEICRSIIGERKASFKIKLQKISNAAGLDFDRAFQFAQPGTCISVCVCFPNEFVLVCHFVGLFFSFERVCRKNVFWLAV